MKLGNKFILLWLGHVTSLLGTHMSGFALGLFIYHKTQSITIYSLFPLFTLLPEICLAPILGVFIDRWNRKRAMIFGHAGAGICSLIIIALIINNIVAVNLILILVAISSIFNGFLYPSFIAATSQLVPEDKLTTASAMNQFGLAIVMIASPAIAGVILARLGLRFVLLMDVITFFIAIIILSALRIPSINPIKKTLKTALGFIQELSIGYKYISKDLYLLLTLFILAIVNFNSGIVNVLIAPLILNMADNSTLGIIMSIAGLGILTGSMALVIFRKSYTFGLILFFALMQGVVFFMVLLELSVFILGVGAFIFMFCAGIVGGLIMMMWQKKVPHGIQGRVFSSQTFVAGGMLLLGFLLSGPLIDQLFGPLMKKEGWLLERILDIIGPSQLPGIEALLLVLGIITIISVMGIYSILKFQGHFTKRLKYKYLISYIRRHYGQN